jgi:hypothetical protein
MQHHRLITGTGRAGTSLLVRVLDACGFEIEISRHHDSVFWDEKANAGIESIPVVGDDHPYVVKSPFSYQFIRELLARPDIKLDGVLLPVRELTEAVASRVILDLATGHRRHDTHQPMEAIRWLPGRIAWVKSSASCGRRPWYLRDYSESDLARCCVAVRRECVIQLEVATATLALLVLARVLYRLRKRR